MAFITAVLLTSKHDPTDAELDASLRAFLESGAHQGYEPLRATAIRTLNGSSVTVEDRERIEKWGASS